ncbi:MAG TPA: PAS domain S-box protein [Labilithrix sp.]
MPADSVRSPGFSREAESLAHVGTWLAERDGIAHCSPEARAILGLGPNDLFTRESYLARVHPDDLERVVDAHRAPFASGLPCDVEHRIQRAGDVRWVRVRGRLFGDRYLGVIQDVTAQKLMFEELQASDRRLWTIVASSMVGVWEIDAEARTVFLNARMAEILGYEVDELMGVNALALVATESLPAIEEKLAAQATVRTQQVDVPYRRRDGSIVHCVLETTTLRSSDGSYAGALAVVVDVSARRRTEDALRDSDERIRLLLDSTGEGLVGIDTAGSCIFANRAAVTMLGYERETDLLGREMHALVHHTRRDGSPCPRGECAFVTSREAGTPTDELFWRKDGTSFEAACRAFPVARAGVRVGSVVSFSDVTTQRRAEASLRQALKMEAIGRLAGGVAHDFNNILSVILSYTSLAAEMLPQDSPVREDLGEVRVAAERAAELTKQLLAFSRQQVLEPKTLDVGNVAAGMEKMLQRLVGEDVDLAFASHGEAFVHADRGQLEQILLNLAVNARDAMPEGGRLEIVTAVVDLDEARAEALGLQRGPYVQLSVTDSGCGMTRDVRARIFEPFFTTKGLSGGTGLGLSTVYGAVKSANGAVGVTSEPGRGARFDVFLPRDERRPTPDAPIAAAPTLRGDETILVVEDNAKVRAVTCSVLRAQGYTVIEASNPGEALLVCEQEDGPIDLMVTDVVMPRMNGRQLVERVAPLRPTMGVLYVSGYTDDDVLARGVRTERVAFMPKPFTPQSLARKVRETLDASGA